jgi:hypothetical protein
VVNGQMRWKARRRGGACWGLLSVFSLEVLLEECEEGVGRGCGNTAAINALEELFGEVGKVHAVILLMRGRVKSR